MILADENINAKLITFLREEGLDVYSVREKHQGITDAQVIELSKNPQRIILTEDKDFGEWVYAHKEESISVILLRYHGLDLDNIQLILKELFDQKEINLFGKFVIVTPQKIRIRSLK